MAMDRPGALTEKQLVRDTLQLIRDRLPAGWSLDSRSETSAESRGAAVLLALAAPDGRAALVEVEAKLSAPTGRQIVGLAQQLLARAKAAPGVPLLIARYLSPNAREQLQKVGVSYADATGNLMISATDPGFYLADRGADADPWRAPGRPRGTLKGEPAARVVRALLDYSRAWRVRDLIGVSGASTGATYRVLEYLDGEGLAERTEHGLWSAPDWERVLRVWAGDYNYLVDGTITRCIDPRGTDRLLEVLGKADRKYVLTGSAAAKDWVSVAPARALSIYTDDTDAAASEWGLRPTDVGANVLLVEPSRSGPVVYSNAATLSSGVRRASAAQVAVDLLNGPGRDPVQGEELIRWMQRNEDAWRLN
jgi:hypothetical protein